MGKERCEASSWRTKKVHQPYGPGGFNRCVWPVGEHPVSGQHKDMFGNVFTLNPSFKVIRHEASEPDNWVRGDDGKWAIRNS